jgi:hypothetical protein
MFHPMNIRPLLLCLLAAAGLALTACNYDVSLTPKPTRQIDARLLGDWVAVDPDDHKEMLMGVRRLDDSTYIVILDGDAYRAFHSDFAGTAFVSVQNLQPGDSDRKYTYYWWQLSADGTQLSLKGVSTRLVPEDTQGRAALQKLIKANLTNPALFGDLLTFTPKKPR